jgi:hypothetical protein
MMDGTGHFSIAIPERETPIYSIFIPWDRMDLMMVGREMISGIGRSTTGESEAGKEGEHVREPVLRPNTCLESDMNNQHDLASSRPTPSDFQRCI